MVTSTAYPPPARRFDARVMVTGTAAVVVASMTTLRTVPAMLGLLVFVCLGHAFVTRDAGTTARRLARVAPFAFLVVLINAVLVPGDALMVVAGHRVGSREGLVDGFFFALRLGVMLMAISVLLAATSPETLARTAYGAVRRVSERAATQVALFVFLAMGFVPLFADEFERIRVAQAFRGGDFAGGMRRRVGAVHAWLVPLLLSAIHRSGQLALAVELRDVRHRLPRTIEAPRARVQDVAVLVVTAAVIIAASMAR
jgi:energy-coupling factor transport system permease protein